MKEWKRFNKTRAISTIKSICTALLITALVTGCSKASTFADLHIEELKGVSFGQSKQDLASTLSHYQMSALPDKDHCSVFTCDGLEAKYHSIKFAPNFLLTENGKLMKVNGPIVSSDPVALAELQSYLDREFGQPQVKNLSRIWSDGGVRVILSSQGSNTGAFDFIEFRSADY
jgi:hypothetical protein